MEVGQEGVAEDGEVLQDEETPARPLGPETSMKADLSKEEASSLPVATDQPQPTIPSMMSSVPQNLLGTGMSFMLWRLLVTSTMRN